MTRECSECAEGEVFGVPAEFKVSHPNPDHAGLRCTKNVCEDHYVMLGDDYGDDVKVIQRYD